MDVWLNLRGDRPPTGRADCAASPSVTNIDYDAKGQRQRIDYGNGASTFYDYDPLTFRLIHLLTRRDASLSRRLPAAAPPMLWPGCQVQNLHYTYDPVGNITHIRDDAQQTIYFRNKRVEPSADYTYDAIYRLIEATGREHLGQTAARRSRTRTTTRLPRRHPTCRTPGRRQRHGHVHRALRVRRRRQLPGNAASRQRPGQPGWTRTLRLRRNQPDRGRHRRQPAQDQQPPEQHHGRQRQPATSSATCYDAHGNMIRMPHLGGAHPAPNMHWDYRDQLRQTDLGGGGTAYYVYDAAGQRVRKVWEKSAEPDRRAHLPRRLRDLPAATRRGRDAGARDAARHGRQAAHRPGGDAHARHAGNDPAPQQLIRYQFGNHLGSASLELDDQAQIISYEEYTPYGSTSYQAVRSQTETPKRYRYTGKERDEESGLYYHGARYYAPWLGRWTSCDPAGW